MARWVPDAPTTSSANRRSCALALCEQSGTVRVPHQPPPGRGMIMKVLQTLGRHGAQEGVFQYARRQAGVFIDGSIGRAALTSITLTHEEWTTILAAIADAPQSSFRLTPTATQDAPNQSLYEFIEHAVPNRVGLTWTDSWKAYVCAILEHEGSVDLYAGALGRGVGANITLARDT